MSNVTQADRTNVNSAILALDRAAAIVGSSVALAKRLRVAPNLPSMWRKRGQVPPKHCAQIERIVGAQVTRRELRPEDWHLIWPELAGADAAKEAA